MKDIFQHQTAVDARDLARYLTALAEAVENGRLPVAESGRVFSLSPRGLIDLDFKVRRKNGRARVRLELSWAEEGLDLPLLTPAREEA